ncbi:MAG: YraN family protein [Clostridiales bacterium]|nr:YraN family protein [Candidatus Crickella merdequi]
MNNRSKGRAGEEYASAMLESKGYRIYDRNYSTAFGEIDIIAVKGRCIHFVEVKARGRVDCGYPSEAVDRRKQSRIRRVAEYYIRSKHLAGYDVCFDVAEVWFNLIEDCY